MEKFKELTEEKQQPIIEAALKCFGKHGYKKASMNDIAQDSGVSKPMLFHYFGTKKDLYLYLSEYVKNVLLEGYMSNEIKACDDFFERIIAASKVKMGILERCPHILIFIISMLTETDPAVRDIAGTITPDAKKFSNNLVIKEGDRKKFKEGVDIDMILRTIFLLAEGYAHEACTGQCDYSTVAEELEKIMYMLKNNLYKEEYL